MNVCLTAKADRDNARLDSLLVEVKQTVDSAQYVALQYVQTTWAEYREKHCGWDASFFEGGSIQPTILATCYSAVTWDRIEKLRESLCEGHGMTGECEASRRYLRPPS